MVRQFQDVVLKSGEIAQQYCITGPEPEWEERVLSRLQHKGELWAKSMQTALREGLPCMKMHFYQLSIDEVAVGNITIVDALNPSIALLQHVFTAPEHRRKGICKLLMTAVTDDFRASGGRAMYLGTGYDTPPFWIYHSFGFRPIGDTGSMVWSDDPDYQANYFTGQDVSVRPACWGDWAPLNALYQIMDGWDLRGVCLGQFAHSSYESAFCRLDRAIVDGTAQQSVVLTSDETGAVVGHAFLMRDAHWPHGPMVLDFFVHPAFTRHADKLLDAIDLPEDTKIQAYCDAEAVDRAVLLTAAGFALEAELRSQYTSKSGTQMDVLLYSCG